MITSFFFFFKHW